MQAVTICLTLMMQQTVELLHPCQFNRSIFVVDALSGTFPHLAATPLDPPPSNINVCF